MAKKKVEKSPNNLVSRAILKELKSCRPLRLFIKKQKKKGSEEGAFALRSKFLHLPTEKQVKYLQKATNKYIELLDDKNINEHVQIEGKLFDDVLSKPEKKLYFQAIDAPTKPVSTPAAYYTEIKKQENDTTSKSWKSLTVDEKKPYIEMLKNAKSDYSIQVKHFSENLPERLKLEYLAYLNPTPNPPHDNDDHPTVAPIRKRRKSVQSLPDSFKTTLSDNQQKLTRTQLDDLHKCKPSVLYYEKKIPDEEKPTFTNSTTKNTYIRSLFNQLSEKKKHKFILKSTKKWEEFLSLNPSITEQQIPTLHLLLGKNEDMHYYFSSLGLPSRPPVSALYLYNNEREQKGSQQYWADLSQTTKDDYIKRLSKLKHEYHQAFTEFVEKTLSSDYFRLEFFRHVKHAAKDYESSTKDRINDNDEGQLKITQYLKPKKQTTTADVSEFDRIKQQLLTTQLTTEQKKLVQRLGQLMNKYMEDTKSNKSSNIKSSPSIDSSDVVIINGELSSDNEQSANKKKKKHKRDRSEIEETNTVKVNNEKEKSAKKRK